MLKIIDKFIKGTTRANYLACKQQEAILNKMIAKNNILSSILKADKEVCAQLIKNLMQ